MVDVVDVHDLNAVALGLLLRAARSGDAGELQTFLLLAAAEFVDEEAHGGTGAEPHDHATFDQLRGLDAGLLLHCILLCFIHDSP